LLQTTAPAGRDGLPAGERRAVGHGRTPHWFEAHPTQGLDAARPARDGIPVPRCACPSMSTCCFRSTTLFHWWPKRLKKQQGS
jgi:hypothetical protein